jgi:predicted lipid-binding transport protein (Tim44 family)
MRHDPTTDELPIQGNRTESGRTVELPEANGPARGARNRADHRTVEVPGGGPRRPESVPVRQESAAPQRKGRFWRELAGALTAGTVLLAAAVLVLQVVAWINGMPGLGVFVLVGHIVGAVLVIATQRIVDRRTGRPALLAGLGLGLTIGAILVLFWWI